mgnify:FL=1
MGRPLQFRGLRLAACGLLGLLAMTPCRARGQEAPAAPQYPLRTWTSVNGNTIEGAFVKEEDGKVFIRRPEGATISTTRAKLSPNDLAWIDTRDAAAVAAPKAQSFPKATMSQTNKREEYKRVRRLILRSYTQLTNNDRDDKSLAFLERDAFSMYGWQFIGSDCYLTKAGKKGKIKEMYFVPQQPVPLREAVQMARDKFVLIFPDPVVAKEVLHNGETCWELQDPPDYVSRVLLLVDPDTQNIRRFDFHFPPPDRP